VILIRQRHNDTRWWVVRVGESGPEVIEVDADSDQEALDKVREATEKLGERFAWRSVGIPVQHGTEVIGIAPNTFRAARSRRIVARGMLASVVVSLDSRRAGARRALSRV